jgi:rod shape-determining protein MreB
MAKNGMGWSPRSILSLFSNDLAIDLGTANTLVYARGKGIVVCEPSIIAVNQKTGKVEASGQGSQGDARPYPGNIIAIRPMKDGVIADFEHTEKMLDHFIKKAHNRSLGVRPGFVIGVPSEITRWRSGPSRIPPTGAKRRRSTWWSRRWWPRVGAGLR